MPPGAWLAVVGALALAAAVVAAVHRRGHRTAAGRRFFAYRPAGLGLFVLALAVLLALGAPLVAPTPPAAQLDIVGLQNRPPSLDHPLGTDLYSRDVWSRLVHGARVSLAVGALATLVAVVLGAAVGAVAGYAGGLADGVLMRLVDVGLSVPRIFLLLVIVGLWDHVPLGALVLAIGATSWFGTSRLVRAEVQSLRRREFVSAARAMGAGPARVILDHLLPNAAAPVIVSAALGVGGVLLLEAGLSFLGVGVAPPRPSWGNMIADARDAVRVAPWCVIFPGLAIALVVMACNAVGDGLRDALDPRRPWRDVP
jgi:peptide/nickel transport system permease protein